MPTSTQSQQSLQTAPDHYTILSLPSSPPPPLQVLRSAYRHALLLHHPDKSTHNQPTPYTIDQITTAYTTLSDPTRRRAYDQRLALNPIAKNATTTPAEVGFETVDLSDMNFVTSDDDQGGIYWRGCRCGREMAFEIPERVLGDYVEEGEVVVGCAGCSLWLRVVFAAVDDQDDDNDAGVGSTATPTAAVATLGGGA